jgi:hypothetical protein
MADYDAERIVLLSAKSGSRPDDTSAAVPTGR